MRLPLISEYRFLLSRRRYPVVLQHDSSRCGASALAAVCRYYGLSYPVAYLSQLCDTDTEGVSVGALKRVAEELGFELMGVKISTARLKDVELPAILHWNQNHFVVLYKISDDFRRFYIADPAFGKKVISKEEFLKGWGVPVGNSGDMQGILLMLEPTADASILYEKYKSKHKEDAPSTILGELRRHIQNYKRHFSFILLLLLVGVYCSWHSHS